MNDGKIKSKLVACGTYCRRVGDREAGGMAPSQHEFTYLKVLSCLKLVGKFFVSIHFKSRDIMKIIKKKKIQGIRLTKEPKPFRKTLKAFQKH